jgi:hypothetical protein
MPARTTAALVTSNVIVARPTATLISTVVTTARSAPRSCSASTSAMLT